jgi:hypothetical protein
VYLDGEAVAGSCDGERNTPGWEGAGKAEILVFEGEGGTGRFVGDEDAVLLVWDSNSRRGEGWRGGV